MRKNYRNVREWVKRAPRVSAPSSLRPVRTVALAALVYLGVATICGSTAIAAPTIYVNGKPTNVPVTIRHNQMFVPIRGVFEQLNAAVTYTPPRTLVARRANTELVQLALGSRIATVNGQNRTLATAPFLSDSRIFVPLRLISEAAEATVVYSTAPQAVRISAAHAVVAAAAVASATDVTAPVAQHEDSLWRMLLLLALIVLGLLFVWFAFLRRRKPEPIITTRSSLRDPIIKTRR